MTKYDLTIGVKVIAPTDLTAKQVKAIVSHLRNLYDMEGFIAEDLVGTEVGGLRVDKVRVTMGPGA